MSTAPRPHSTRCGFGKFCRVPAAPCHFWKCCVSVVWKCEPRQHRVPRGRSYNDESLQNRDFSEVIVSDNNSYFSCLSYSFYLRFSNASGRKFVGRILLLVFLQVACYSHCSDALARELLIQNSGQVTGRHLTGKCLQGCKFIGLLTTHSSV